MRISAVLIATGPLQTLPEMQLCDCGTPSNVHAPKLRKPEKHDRY